MTLSQSPSGGGKAHDGAYPAVIRDLARAKVNLTLHVLGKRPDGYHELDSLVVFADLGDALTFTPGTEDGLGTDGPFAQAVDGENLILKAKRVTEGWLGREVRGHFHLEKRLPVAAGLGGGSSDAAAAIRVLLQASGNAANVESFIEKAAAVGADVPVCLYNRAAWMRGLGERVTAAPHLAPLPAILVNPRIKVSTAEVFKRLNARALLPHEGRPEALAGTDFSSPEKAATSLAQGRNDLEPPAIAIEPAVERTLNTIRRQEGCLLQDFRAADRPALAYFQRRQWRAEPRKRLRANILPGGSRP